MRIALAKKQGRAALMLHPEMQTGSVAATQQEIQIAIATIPRQPAKKRRQVSQGMVNRMSYDKAADLIREHEGYRDHVYIDSVGIPTCGYGHALIEGSYVPHHIALQFFYQDFRNAISDYNLFTFELDSVRRAVVLNMLFNLGIHRFKKFKKLINALYARDWTLASVEMLDSKWAKQVGKRATELSKMMKSGEWSDG